MVNKAKYKLLKILRPYLNEALTDNYLTKFSHLYPSISTFKISHWYPLCYIRLKRWQAFGRGIIVMQQKKGLSTCYLLIDSYLINDDLLSKFITLRYKIITFRTFV